MNYSGQAWADDFFPTCQGIAAQDVNEETSCFSVCQTADSRYRRDWSHYIPLAPGVLVPTDQSSPLWVNSDRSTPFGTLPETQIHLELRPEFREIHTSRIRFHHPTSMAIRCRWPWAMLMGRLTPQKLEGFAGLVMGWMFVNSEGQRLAQLVFRKECLRYVINIELSILLKRQAWNLRFLIRQKGQPNMRCFPQLQT